MHFLLPGPGPYLHIYKYCVYNKRYPAKNNTFLTSPDGWGEQGPQRRLRSRCSAGEEERRGGERRKAVREGKMGRQYREARQGGKRRDREGRRNRGVEQGSKVWRWYRKAGWG